MNAILVVEDDPADMELLLRVMQPYGWEIDTASTIEEATARLESRRYRAVLLNLTLRGRDGTPLITLIKQRWRDTLVQVVTGADDPRTKENAIAAGAVGFYVKPYTSRDNQSLLNMLDATVASYEKGKVRRLKDPKAWGYGLLSGFIGGGATAGKAWLATLIAHEITPKAQVLDWHSLWAVFLAGGITFTMGYLAQSPLPPMDHNADR